MYLYSLDLGRILSSEGNFEWFPRFYFFLITKICFFTWCKLTCVIVLQLNVYSLAIIFLLFGNISVCLFFLCGSEEIQSMLEQGFLRHGDNLVVRWIPHYSHDLSHFHLLSCTFISSQRWKLKQYSCMLKIFKKKKKPV